MVKQQMEQGQTFHRSEDNDLQRVIVYNYNIYILIHKCKNPF